MPERADLPPIGTYAEDSEVGKSAVAGPLLTDLLRIQQEQDVFESAVGAAVHLEELMRANEEEVGDISLLPTMAQMEDVHLSLLAVISEQALRIYRLGHNIRPPGNSG